VNMPTAFCPGHVTCFFSPGKEADSIPTTGSRGVGIRTTLGATVTVDEVAGSRITVIMDGKEQDCPVTCIALRDISGDRGLEVVVENGLPVSQGFGMSAAGAVAAALCAASIAGVPEEHAWSAAHHADIAGGGGLGDVSALHCNADVPLRVEQGLPPAGKVASTGVRFPVLTLAVVGGKVSTGAVLGLPERRRRIASAGSEALESFGGTKDSLFEQSRRFSLAAGVESPEVAEAIGILGRGRHRAGMCMLGNSVFTDAPYLMVKDALPDAQVFSAMSTSEPARIIRS